MVVGGLHQCTQRTRQCQTSVPAAACSKTVTIADVDEVSSSPSCIISNITIHSNDNPHSMMMAKSHSNAQAFLNFNFRDIPTTNY